MKKVSAYANLKKDDDNTEFEFKFVDGSKERYRIRNIVLQHFFVTLGAQGSVAEHEPPKQVAVLRSKSTDHVLLEIAYSNRTFSLLLSKTMAADLSSQLMFATAPRA